MGGRVAGLVSPGRDVENIDEGSEPDDFWAGIGGQGDYQKARTTDRPALSARLFHCSISAAGRLRVREVGNFGQEVRIFIVQRKIFRAFFFQRI